MVTIFSRAGMMCDADLKSLSDNQPTDQLNGASKRKGKRGKSRLMYRLKHLRLVFSNSTAMGLNMIW